MWLVSTIKTPRRHQVFRRILEIAEELQEMEGRMTRVKRVWEMGEKPVDVSPYRDYDVGLYVSAFCPQCGMTLHGGPGTGPWYIACACGAKLRLVLEATLEELEVEG